MTINATATAGQSFDTPDVLKRLIEDKELFEFLIDEVRKGAGGKTGIREVMRMYARAFNYEANKAEAEAEAIAKANPRVVDDAPATTLFLNLASSQPELDNLRLRARIAELEGDLTLAEELRKQADKEEKRLAERKAADHSIQARVEEELAEARAAKQAPAEVETDVYQIALARHAARDAARPGARPPTITDPNRGSYQESALDEES